MIRHIVIAIDGPAAAGKTTVGKAVARKLKTAFLDSGRLYRVAAVSSLMLNSNLPELLDQIDLKLTKNKFIVNGVDVTDKLDTVEVGERASVMSVDPRLREWVNKTIRKIALDESVVVTGRDIGTVVLPDAEVKVYLDASHEARVERRFKDERGRFSREEISGALLKRDKRDSERDIAPLKPADDSHIIDSTNLRIGQVVQKITNIAKSELAKTKLTKWWRFSYFVASNLSRWLFDIEINGKGNIPSVGPVVAVANHASLLDVFFVGLALPRMGSYIAKKELFRIPVISACVRGFGAIPVDRDNIGRGLVLAINKALKADKLLTIYPGRDKVKNRQVIWRLQGGCREVCPSK